MTSIHRVAPLVLLACCATVFEACDRGRVPSAPSALPSLDSPPPAGPTPPTGPTLRDLSGDYSMTLVAQCDFPWPGPTLATEFRSRTYASRLEQSGTSI